MVCGAVAAARTFAADGAQSVIPHHCGLCGVTANLYADPTVGALGAARALCQVQQETEIRVEQVDDIMSTTDADSDRLISFDEFLPWYRKMAEKHWRSTHGGVPVSLAPAPAPVHGPVVTPQPVQGAVRVKLQASGPAPKAPVAGSSLKVSLVACHVQCVM